MDILNEILERQKRIDAEREELRTLIAQWREARTFSVPPVR